MSSTSYRPSTVRRVLEVALSKIQSGWCQGANQQRTHGRVQYCAMGALRAAKARRPYLRTRARELLEQGAGLRYGSIIGWNDKQSRTKAEVVTAFKRAIDKA